MPKPTKILRPSEAARLLLEDILKDEGKRAIAADVVERTKELSLRDSADPDYTMGDLVLNQVYDTPLEGMTEMQEAFKTQLYIPLGFVMCNEDQSEEELADDFMSFWTQSMLLIQYVGKLARAIFADGSTLDKACERYLARPKQSSYKEQPEQLRLPHEHVTPAEASVDSCETRVIETGETGREKEKE